MQTFNKVYISLHKWNEKFTYSIRKKNKFKHSAKHDIKNI